MKNLTKIIPAFFASALFSTALIACGNDSSSSANDESSSSMSSEASSSSAYSNRLDAHYADTLSRDTITLSSADETNSYRLFLGDLPKGSRIRIFTSGNVSDSLLVREEEGEILTPEIFTADDGDTTYSTAIYARIGETATFVTTAETGYYYVDIPGVKDSSYSIKISADVKSGYFAYVGDTDSLEISADTTRGVIVLANAPSKITATFTAKTGKSLGLTLSGKSLNKISLSTADGEVASGNPLEQQLSPKSDTEYFVTVVPQVSSYLTGPFAYFEIVAAERELLQGEYFAHPDSIKMIGDTLTIVRERNDQARYYLRQEQYVYLANLDKGDTINVYHSIEGYYSGVNYPATYAILDSAGDSISAVTLNRPQFVAPAKGPYYLHYVRLNSPPNTSSQVLTLKTLVQRYHYAKSFYFYDEERLSPYESKTVSLGDTLAFSKLSLRAEPSDIGADAQWYVPCENLTLLQTAYSVSQCQANGTEQLIGASNVVISTDESKAGETFSLIAQSKADPRIRATLTVVISE